MNADVPWQNFAYFAMAIPSLPLYVVILSVIVHGRMKRRRFLTTFYALLLSLGIADIFSQITGCFSNIIRTFNIFNEFYWQNRAWIAPMSYNCVMYCLTLRLFGATLIAIQRFFIVCLHTHRITEKLIQIPLYIVIFVHWIPPFIYNLPVITNFNKTLMGPDDMRLDIPPSEATKGNTMQNSLVLILFLVSAYCYLSIFVLIMKHKNVRNSGLSSELRLSIVALGQAIAFCIIFSYHTLSFILTMTQSPYLSVTRPYMTILTGLISYWNPWVYILVNGDLRKEMKRIFYEKKILEIAVVGLMRRHRKRKFKPMSSTVNSRTARHSSM